MSSKNFLAYQDIDMPKSRQSSRHPLTGSNSVVRHDHEHDQDQHQAKSQITECKRRIESIENTLDDHSQRLKGCVDRSTAAKSINYQAHQTAQQALRLAEYSRSANAAEHTRLTDFKDSQEKYDNDVWRQIKGLKTQVAADRDSLASLRHEVSKISSAVATASEDVTLRDIKQEIVLLKRQNAEMQDGSAAFTSLLKDWLKSKEATTGQPLEEGEWNALAEAPPSNLLIKVVMGGILKLNRDHQELEQNVKIDIELLRAELQRLSGTSQQGPIGQIGIKRLNIRLNQLDARMTDTQKMFTKQFDLQITEKASMVSKVDAYTSLVRQYVKKQGGVGLTAQEDERLKNERDQIYQWTCRFLNLLSAAPSANDAAKMDKYDHNIMTMEQMISEEGGRMNQAEAASLLNIVGSIKRVAELTRETVESISADQKTLKRSSQKQHDSGLQTNGAGQAVIVSVTGQEGFEPAAASSAPNGVFAEHDLVPAIPKKRALSFDDSGNRFGGGEVKPTISTEGIAYSRSDGGVDRADGYEGAAAGKADRYGAGVGKADYYRGGGVASSSHWSPSHKRRRTSRGGPGPGLPY